MSDFNILKQYAHNQDDLDCLNLLSQGLSQREVAEALDTSKKAVESRLRRIRARSETTVWDEEGNAKEIDPSKHVVKGTSTLYDEDGKQKLQWVKLSRSHEEIMETMKDIVEGMKDEIPRIQVPEFLGTDLNSDIIPWFNIGDAHIGALAHKIEVGTNNDIKTTERELLSAMFTLIEEIPACERCVINDLGDATHYETFDGVTMGHGHMLDYDTRYPKMISSYVRIIKAIITKALEKFKYVDVIINQGNHSRSNDIFMRELLMTAFDDCDRLHVLDNSNVFIPYRMGNTFVMCHHGDKAKSNVLSGVMATDYSKDWGESTYRYIYTGHVHHREVLAKEQAGVTIESWNSMSRGDKYAHDGGWRSRSCLTVVELSKTYGEIGRRTIPIERVQDIINNDYPGTAAKESRREVYAV